MSIAVVLPTGGSNRWETTWSLVNAMRAGVFDEFRTCSTIYVDEGRNGLTRWFLEETPYDKILYIDGDMSFLPEDIERLDATNLDCVSGIYFNIFEGTYQPVFKPLPETEITDDPVMPVEMVGAGFLMVTRGLLEKMAAEYGEPMPWFAMPIIDGRHMGEDVEFCRRVWEIGSQVYVDIGVQLSHYKTVRLTAPTSAPTSGKGKMPHPAMEVR